MQCSRLRPLAALAVLIAATATTTPPPAQAPVVFSDCRGGIESVELVEIAAYDVTFHLTAAVAADEIRLSIPYGRHGKRADFDLHGTFAPQVDVTRALRRTVRGGLFAYMAQHNDCRVDYVHFADGSVWTRPG